MLVLHSRYRLDPEHREQALARVEELVEASRQEDGVRGYDATLDLQDPNVIHFFDRYEDEAALQAHATSDHVQRFEEQLPDLLAAEPTVTQFSVDDVTELPTDVGVEPD